MVVKRVSVVTLQSHDPFNFTRIYGVTSLMDRLIVLYDSAHKQKQYKKPSCKEAVDQE